MKRYLFRGATALVLGGFIAACSHDDIDYSSIVDGKLKAYQEVFVDAYGKIDPNQNWGFTTISGQGAKASRATRAITVNGDTYPAFNFPTESELTSAFPTTIPSDADEVSQLETLYKGQTVQTPNGEIVMHDLYAIYVNKIVEGYNLKITQAGEVELGGTYQNSSYDQAAGKELAHPYNVYVNVNGNVTIKRSGATHFNLYILSGNVTLLSNYGEQAGLISVAEGATLNDGRNSIAANQGVKLYNRGTVNATNTEKYDIGNFSSVYNEGKFNISGALTYSPGDANTSYFVNFGDGAELTAPSMTMNSSCHFYNSGKVNVTGETFVTQARINWINNGYYTTGAMTFSAKNSTFYNYCQLIVKEECKFMDGEFNLMNNSYAQIGKGKMDNFIVNMGDNAGINILNGCNYGRQGDGTYQGFYAFDDYAKAYVRIGGISRVPVQQEGSLRVKGANLTFAYDTMIFYEGWKSLDDDGYSVETTQAKLDAKQDPRIEWNKYNVTKIITGDDFARTGFVVRDGQCAATWVSSDTQYIPIDQSETSDDRSVVETIVEYYETTELIEQGRVFCEDLGQISTNDLDFNDVVFDAYVYKVTPMTRTVVRVDGVLESDDEIEGEPTYKTTIILLAAGGTLPLSIADSYQVHNVMGSVPVSTIVNTIVDDEGAYHNSWSTHDPVVLGTEFTYRTIEEIPIQVQYGNGETLKLEAITGWAPHKILVPIGTKWCKERVDIATAYTTFKDYVGGEDGFWTNGIEESLLYTHPMDTYRPRSMEPSKKLIGADEPVITYRPKGTTIITGGYQNEEVLSRKNVWFNE